MSTTRPHPAARMPGRAASITDSVPVTFRLGVEQPTATRSLARLETGGWFRREPVPADRRQVRIVVTDAGRELLPAIERAWAELADEAMGEVSEEQRHVVLTVLEQANDTLRALVGEAALADG
ncbi:MarR family transcriptional regulator [Actinomadura sp. ATCC 31491]|uniref:MarR family transcriptional regulator n=1 Tax=Actinomadura luzonensis TaxID=2805427 RepID=A0ABT0FLU8_9ACTN|nr:MarR family transcriptional regulator [Actinomadura luzonensis]MCK2213287.1 MarR family transcriptional regulator [Actinomadura luzonensis]